MKIRGLLIVKNEIDILPVMLKSCSFIDDIVAIDNGSEDGTFELLQNTPKVIKCVRDLTPFSEKYFANSFMDLIDNSDVDWFVNLDADELYCDKFLEFKSFLNGLDFNINTITRPDFYMFPFNKDENNKPLYNDEIFWRMRPLLKRFYRNVPHLFNKEAEHLIGYHCGKIPIDYKHHNVFDLDWSWFARHYQFRTPEQSKKKYEQYVNGDKEHSKAYDYMKIIIHALETEDFSRFTLKTIQEIMPEEKEKMKEAIEWRNNKFYKGLGL